MFNGFFLAVLSAFIYGIEPTVRSLAFDKGGLVSDSVFICAFFSFLFGLINCYIKHEKIKVAPTTGIKLFFAGCFGSGLTNYLLSSACLYMPVGCVTVIHFLYPIIVCNTMIIFFKAKISFSHIVAILLSLTGLLCIGGEHFSGSLKGITYAFLSSLTYSAYIVFIDKGIKENISANVKYIYVILGVLTIGFILFLSNNNHFVTPFVLFSFTISGLLYFLASLFFIMALERIGSIHTSFTSIFEPITSLIVSTIVFHYTLSTTTIVGCFLAILSIVFLNIGNMQRKKNI